MVAVALHQVGEVVDHVVAPVDEVLPVVGAADRGLVHDHQAHLVGDVEHVRRGGHLVDADAVVVEPQVVVDRLRPAAVARRRLQEAGQGVVGVAAAVDSRCCRSWHPGGCRRGSSPGAVELVVVTDLGDLAEAEPHVESRTAWPAVAGRAARQLVQLRPVAGAVGHVGPPVRGLSARQATGPTVTLVVRRPGRATCRSLGAGYFQPLVVPGAEPPRAGHVLRPGRWRWSAYTS